jgi:hypothetical protein
VGRYDKIFQLLLKSLGPAVAPTPHPAEELSLLKSELAQALELAKAHQNEARRAGDAAFRAKSEELQHAIEQANAKFPEHAPINRTYAFECGYPVTLDYALWAISKSAVRGSHPLEVLLTLENKWPDLNSMLEAYKDMLERQKASE